MNVLKNLALLQMIRLRPGMFIKEKSLSLLDAYLGGYNHALSDIEMSKLPVCDKELLHSWDEFEWFIHDRYQIFSYYDAIGIIRLQCDDDEKAFDMFYELLDEFLAMEKKDDD